MRTRNVAIKSDNIIRGKCSLFVCRGCRTKYGWEHQEWCEFCSVTNPSCKDCRYYRQIDSMCVHPGNRSGKE